ncbi:MAG: serine O-acetyltransferase [Tildeniella torsiva UHER 1998/13D]|nr:serine O-acetyltransferase [Tildeniella torsiva UHER 1998/13D]
MFSTKIKTYTKNKNFWSSFELMLLDLKADIARYSAFSSLHWILLLISTKGLWVSTQYRFSRWVHFYCHLLLIRQCLKVLCFFSQKVVEALTGAEIANRAQIGKGVFMPHTNGIVIHTDAIIGENCNIGHQVTIGIGGRGRKRGVPIVGDRVFIGPGAKLFGSFLIGSDAAIGANAVVTKDIPANAVALGIPARVVNFEGSKDYVVI